MAKTILVCDDDPEMRRTLVLALADRYRVVEAADGREALRLIEAEKPDLVLLDMSMPGMTGLETLRAYRKTHPALPAIMLTARRRVGIARRVLASGASSFVTKPFDREQIRAEVQRILEPASGESSGRPWRVKT